MSGVKNQGLLQKRELVKIDYLSGEWTVEELAVKHELSVHTLSDWIKVGRYGDPPWSLLKKERQVAQKREVMDKASLSLPRVFKTGSEILDYGFLKIRDNLMAGIYEGREADIVKSTIDSMLKIYKILRLDDNKSTSNTAIAVEKIDSKETTKELAKFLEGALGETINLEADDDPDSE